jgi:excisionase family DNA binding protein
MLEDPSRAPRPRRKRDASPEKVDSKLRLALKIIAEAKAKELAIALEEEVFAPALQRVFAIKFAESAPRVARKKAAQARVQKRVADRSVDIGDIRLGRNTLTAKSDNGEYLSTEQAAKELELAAGTISHYCLAGKPLRGVRVGKDWKVPRAEVERYKRQRRKAGRPIQHLD